MCLVLYRAVQPPKFPFVPVSNAARFIREKRIAIRFMWPKPGGRRRRARVEARCPLRVLAPLQGLPAPSPSPRFLRLLARPPLPAVLLLHGTNQRGVGKDLTTLLPKQP